MASGTEKGKRNRSRTNKGKGTIKATKPKEEKKLKRLEDKSTK